MSRPPLVSVVMTVYNGEKYLAAAVESILGQTFRDFEFIIIDDGSTDKTPELLNAFAAKDARISVLRQPNHGLCYSLNRGCAAAHGKYIARMDADDVSLPKRLELQVAFLEQNPRTAALGTELKFLDDNGTSDCDWNIPTQPDEVARQLLKYNALPHSSVLMRRAVFEELGGYRFQHTEDYDLWLRMSDRYELTNLPAPLMHYRLHPGQKSVQGACGTALFHLAARYCAAERRAGRPDPFGRRTNIPHREVLQIGIPPTQVADALLAAPMDVVRRFVAGGELRLARSFLGEMERLLLLQRTPWHYRATLAREISQTYVQRRELVQRNWHRLRSVFYEQSSRAYEALTDLLYRAFGRLKLIASHILGPSLSSKVAHLYRKVRPKPAASKFHPPIL